MLREHLDSSCILATKVPCDLEQVGSELNELNFNVLSVPDSVVGP